MTVYSKLQVQFPSCGTIKSENNEIETYLTCCSPPAVALHPPLWEPLVYTADVLFIFHKSMRRFQTPLCTN